MKHDQIFTPELRDIRKYSSRFSSLDRDYSFARVCRPENFSEFTKRHLKLEGLTIILCMKGTVEMDVNLTSYTLTPDSLLLVGPGAVLDINHVQWDEIDLYVFSISPEFMRDINLEFNLVASMSITSSPSPLIHLTPEEMSLMVRYLELVHYNTVQNTDARYVRSISRSMISATAYQLMQLFSQRLEKESPSVVSRSAGYAREFLNLLTLHHKQERTVGFYASKLLITPKYLSLLIKQSTGRSAAQWIDDYVILEAKNQLRFSGKNVQQVAYDLNFNNQSAFGKYFKHITGMSPTQFQRS